MQPVQVDSNKETTLALLLSFGYKEIREIGRGSFGQVYTTVAPEGVRAVKTQSKDNIKPMLAVQYEIMSLMRGVEGFPQVYSYTQLEELNFIQMQLLSKSLDKLLNECGNRFTIKTSLIVMLQVLDRLKELHAKGYVYRDVKPSNFMVGEDPTLLYILDFGLVKKITKARPSSPTKNNKTPVNKLVGTPIFSSVSAHTGENQTARDDLESLVYMGIYFIRPLPWQNITQDNKALKQDKIRQVKQATKDEDLCKDLPKQYLQTLRRVKDDHEEQPDYQQIKSLLLEALKATDPRKNVYPDWFQPVVEKPKQEVKINFQIKPRQKKKLELELETNGNLFQQLVSKPKQ